MHRIPPTSTLCRGYLIIYILNSTNIWCTAQILTFFKTIFKTVSCPFHFILKYSSQQFLTPVYILLPKIRGRVSQKHKKKLFLYIIHYKLYISYCIL